MGREYRGGDGVVWESGVGGIIQRILGVALAVAVGGGDLAGLLRSACSGGEPRSYRITHSHSPAEANEIALDYSVLKRVGAGVD